MTTRIHGAAIALSRAVLAACIIGMAACVPAASPQAPVIADEAQPAQAVTAPAGMSFIVNFRASHALGQAQSLQGAGRYDEAEQLVGVTLHDDAAFRGLCFERFTLGGAEIVLNVCAPSPWEEPLVTQRRWLEQLGATPGVVYVERNLVAQREHSAEAGAS